MWSDLSNIDLVEAARNRTRRGEPLPLDLEVELMARGILPPHRN